MTITNRADGANGFDPDFADPPQWAAMYRAARFQPVPAWSPAERKDYKRPKLSEWRKIQGVILPQDQFDRIWAENATRKNMGVVTGECSDNLLVVDLDTQKTTAAADWWNGLLAVHNNNLPLETVEQRTGGGGRQLLFRAPAGRVVPTCKTPIGVDIRGHGGFAMLPPSLHESGNEYVWLPGQEPWEIEVAAAPDWLLDAIDALVKQHGGGARSPGMGEGGSRPSDGPEAQYDGFGQQTDGREETMRDVVWHAVLELYRASPVQPPEAEWVKLAEGPYEGYERRVTTRIEGISLRDGLEQEGRGWTEFLVKWRATMRKWGEPNFTQEARKPPPDPDAGVGFGTAKPDPNPNPLYERLDVKQIKAMADPKWLVERLIIENSLGFIFGAPGTVKTFLALDLSLSFATGRKEWWGRKVEHNGTVIYVSSEGFSDLKFRIMAWEQQRGVNADDASFRLIREGINFTKLEDIQKLLATIEAVVAETKTPVTAVIVDTVSRVLPGVDENLQKDMTMFVNGCDAVRRKFATTVIGLHHTARAGNMRGSTVIPGAGDFVIEMRREPGAQEGSFYVSKLKAAQDGEEQHFKMVEVAVGMAGEHTSVVLEPIDAQAAAGGWPNTNMEQRVLYAITEGWASGKPWSSSPQSGERYAPRIMDVKFQIPIKIGKEWLEKALIEGRLTNETYDTKRKIVGLKVV